MAEPSPMEIPAEVDVQIEAPPEIALDAPEVPTIPSHTYVAIGGGNAAGYWAYQLIRQLTEANIRERSIAIISTYPEGLLPYERPALTKGAINPANVPLRNFASGAFPCTMKGAGMQALPLSWYQENGITIYWQSDVTSVDFEAKLLTVDRQQGRSMQIKYDKLVLATGSTSRTLEGGPTEPLWTRRHPDIHSPGDGSLTLNHPERYGFGSVHYPRDLGCIVALTRALTRIEEIGQVPCEDPVVLIGGGYISLEAAAGIVSFAPHLKVVICISGPYMIDTLFPPSIADFYEKKLAAKGVMFARNVRFKKWWPVEEHGEFPTLGGDPFNLKPVEPRPFRKCSKEFTECRGVILQTKEGQEVHMPARFVVCGVGSLPNSRLFKDTLNLSPKGFIITDDHLRTGAPDVYAVGDVCCFPLPLDDYALSKLDHVQHARESAAFVAKCMVSGDDAFPAYDPVPYFYSRYLDLAWKFYGISSGEAVVLGLKDFESTKELAVVWVDGGVLVGVFLEGGTADMQASMPKLARARPRISSIAKLARMSVQEFFQDPYALVPPPLSVGDFHAEVEEDAILTHLQAFDSRKSGTVPTEALGEIMVRLGAMWSPQEAQEVGAFLDPDKKGVVRHSTFCKWWKSEQDKDDGAAAVVSKLSAKRAAKAAV